MIGATNPLNSVPGTLRGDFSINMGKNIIHGSDAVETAEREIGIWFDESELVTWTSPLHPHVYEGP